VSILVTLMGAIDFLYTP